MAVPQKIKSRITVQSRNSTSGVYSRIQIRVSKRYLNTHVHSSIIQNSQKVDTTQFPLTDE